MKKVFATILLCTAALASTSWAQTASEPVANNASGGSTDEIVIMRQQISAANKAYDRKVATAKKVYDAQKAAAAKVRDEAIAAARSGAS
jgi:hypothetical protein